MGPMVDAWVSGNQGEMVPLSLDSTQPHNETTPESPELLDEQKKKVKYVRNVMTTQTIFMASYKVEAIADTGRAIRGDAA